MDLTVLTRLSFEYVKLKMTLNKIHSARLSWSQCMFIMEPVHVHHGAGQGGLCI